MKIKFSYLPEESGKVERAVAEIMAATPGVRRKDSDRHPPFLHTYLFADLPKKVAEQPFL